MNYTNNNGDMWDWQSRDFSLEDNASLEMSECLLNGGSKDDDHLFVCDEVTTTPPKACGGLAYHVPSDAAGVAGKSLGHYVGPEPSSQFKRRRMLQFEPEAFDAVFTDDAFLRSQETQESLGDTISEMSEWVAGFAGDDSGVKSQCLDPSDEGWIADCFSDADLNFSNEDLSSTSGASDIQIDISDFCNAQEYVANSMEKRPISTRTNVVFKGRKSYMHTPPKLASSVVKPFAFIKPCGAQGDVTLNDINKRIHTPPKPKQIQPSVSYPTSAFSGKPVVGKTKIHTEGGKGSITIMRTKG